MKRSHLTRLTACPAGLTTNASTTTVKIALPTLAGELDSGASLR